MKIIKKILLASTSALLLPIASCNSSISFSKNEEKTVVLTTNSQYINIGEHVQIQINKGAEPTTNFNWSIDSPTDKIYVVQTGVVFAAKEIQTEDSITVKVKAVDKNNPERSGEIVIDVVPPIPESETNLLGFRFNGVGYKNYMGEDCYNKIIRKSKYEYVLEEPIDVVHFSEKNFMFNIVPIVRDGTSPMMQWWFSTSWEQGKGDGVFKFMNYSEGADTDICPEIFVYNITQLQSPIYVRFLCNGYDEDKMPVLTINTNIWQNPQQTVNGIFVYLKESKDDNYVLETDDKGDYKMKLFSPSNPSSQVYSHLISNLYFFKDLHQYSDYSFYFRFEDSLDYRIKDAFEYSISFVRTRRKYDNFPLYRVAFWYGFDMSKMPSAEEMSHKNVTVGWLYANERPSVDRAGIKFTIDWI